MQKGWKEGAKYDEIIYKYPNYIKNQLTWNMSDQTNSNNTTTYSQSW
jgi:hypothetical protein